MPYDPLSFLGGVVMGVVAAGVFFTRRVASVRRESALLRSQLSDAGAAQMKLAELRTHLSGLRHDIRGILSPALLVADKLIGHEEPGIRRAGEVMVRTVDRATTRLAETRLDQDEPNNPQP